MSIKNTVLKNIEIYQNQILVVLIPIILIPIPVIANGDEKALCAYVIILMSIFYIVGALPLGVTTTIPLILFPLLGVLSSAETAAAYSTQAVWVQFGTLICGIAFEKVGLNRRMAFVALKFVGPKPARLIWMFAFLSYCISMITTNVAAAIAILTIVEAMLTEKEALLQSVEETEEQDEFVEAVENTAFESQESDIDNEKQSNVIIEKRDMEESSMDAPKIVFKQLSLDSEANTSSVDAGIKSYNLKQAKTEDDNWGYALGNAVKFGCTLGGMSTPMGSALNILILERLGECYSEDGKSSPLTFATWMATLLPICVLALSIVCLGLQLYFIGISSFTREAPSPKKAKIDEHMREWIKKEYDNFGSVSYAEIVVAILFALLVLLWFFMDPGFMPGWAVLFKDGFIGSVVPTFVIVFLLFVIPEKPCLCGDSNTDKSKATTIMDWPTVRHKNPWQLPMLFGAGLASSRACEESGLDIWLGEQLGKLSHLDPGTLVFLLCLLAAFATEILSSSLMLNIFLPVMCDLSVSLGKSPAYLAVPIAFCINSNFMMPNQMTNALCLQFKKTTVLQLMATGFFGDLVFVTLITISTLTWFVPILEYDDPFYALGTNATTAAPDF